MEDKEIFELKRELIKELSKGAMEIIKSPKVKSILKELHKRGAKFGPQQMQGMISDLLSQEQAQQSFQDLPQTIRGNIKELVETIREAVKEGIEDSGAVGKIEKLERYGIEIKLGVSLAVLLSKKSPPHFISDDENWKKWLKGKGISWN